MHAEMTGQPMPSSNQTTVRPSLVILFFLALIALGIFGYNAGWFKNSGDRASEWLATASTSIERFFTKVRGTSTRYPATAAQPSQQSEVVAESASPPVSAPLPARDVPGENEHAPAATWTPGLEERLDAARAAFAAGDINAAVENYRALLASHPDNIAAPGELGNVFHAIGMIPAAAQAYFDAASKAIDQNQFDIAESLLPAIAEGSPMLASQLSDRIYAVGARANMGQPRQPTPGMYDPYRQPMPSFIQPGDRY